MIPPRGILVQIRPYRQEDLPELERIHKAQGFNYAFPDLENQSYFIKLVGVDDDGKIVQAAVAHLSAELYFFIDPKVGTPQERWKNFQELHRIGMEQLWYPGGLDDVYAMLPPPIEKRFGKRLMSLGWVKNLWKCYSREL